MVGTPGELAIYTALVQLGKKPGLDFTFQPGIMGGRIGLGGLEAQFLFTNPPGLAINVRPVELVSEARSFLSRLMLAQASITLVEYGEAEVLTDARGLVERALRQGVLG